MQQIYSEDIKLYESEKMNDAADGGGRITSKEIESGQVNNVFQDISRVDHANGSVEIRKIAGGIKTENNAPLLGFHVVVTEPPEDPNVGVVLFQTPRDGRETDTRAVARDYLETYFVRAAREFAQPLGLNLEGSNILSLFAPRQVSVNIAPGDTIVLHDKSINRDEYVKISSTSQTQQTFVYQSSSGSYTTFQGKLIRAQLSAPLQYTWDGGEARPSGVTNDNMQVFSTAISNAARYRGVTKLATELSAHETVLQAEAVMQPLVPVARQERALVNQSPYADLTPVIRSTDSNETPLEIEVNIADDVEVIYMPTAITKQTLTISTSDSDWSDQGDGVMVQESGVLNAEITVSYTDGLITLHGMRNKTVTCSYLPAAAPSVPAVTTSIEITQGNLGLIYTFDLSDLRPEPGTVTIEYLTSGEWLSIQDDGFGQMEGAGVGEVDYNTGQVQVTLEHEPEVGSFIILNYLPGGGELLERRSGSLAAEAGIERRLNFGNSIKPGTVTIKTVIDGQEKTSTDDGAGNFSGDAGTGRVDYVSGEFFIEPSAGGDQDKYEITADEWEGGLIDPNSLFRHFRGSVSFQPSGRDLVISVGKEIQRGFNVRVALRAGYVYAVSSSITGAQLALPSVVFTDAGDGTVWRRRGGSKTSVQAGTVNYSLGEITLEDFFWDENYIVTPFEVSGTVDSSISSEQIAISEEGVGFTGYVLELTPEEAGGSFVEKTRELNVLDARLYLRNDKSTRPIMPRTLWATINGENYFDDGDGKIVKSYSAATGAGVQVGTIDYTNGVANIADVVVDDTDKIKIKSMMVAGTPVLSSGLIFAIKDRPIRHGSYQMNWRAKSGDVQLFEDNGLGVIVRKSDNAEVGAVNVDTGVVTIDADMLPGSSEDKLATLGSLRYNAIKSESLPADPEIIGLNVQRLPIDGRVPIFKLGDTIVLNHWDSDAIDEPQENAVVQLSRDHLAEVQVLCGGEALDREQYEVDLEAGTVTFSSDLVLQDNDKNPLSGAWEARHRIEHMSLATRVQMNGNITLQTPSAHTFPEGASVSSALLFGDLQADVLNVFEQATWQQGSPNWGTGPDSSGGTTARFDTVNYPVELTNESAITDSWALWFRTPSTVDVVSKELGVVATSLSISNDIAPINPNTEKPYFVVRRQGWGSGWATNNVLRFDTVSALAPFWIARTVTPSQGITQSDSFTLSPRGDSQ